MVFGTYNTGWLTPWRRLRELERNVGRLFGEPDRPTGGAFPAVNVWTNADGAVITAEIPGVDPADVDITAAENTLTIRGERKADESGQERVWHRRERRTGVFARTVTLPFAIDSDSVQASCHDGVLEVSLARPEQQKPRKITVKSE